MSWAGAAKRLRHTGNGSKPPPKIPRLPYVEPALEEISVKCDGSGSIFPTQEAVMARKNTLIEAYKKHLQKSLNEERRKAEKVVVIKGTLAGLYVTVAK
jgi:hypothetical protein